MKNKVTLTEVRHMASLSRLALSSSEEELFCSQLGAILGHMQILNSVPTEGVEPLYTPANEEAPGRLDESINIRDRSEILANAPETDGECFIVPRIV